MAILRKDIEETIVFVEETRPQVEKILRRALRQGHTIQLEDGRRQWLEEEVVERNGEPIEKPDPCSSGWLWRVQRFVITEHQGHYTKEPYDYQWRKEN